MTLHEKMVAIQSDLKAPKGQTNAFGKYRYRSCEDILEAVKPLLKQHNLILTLSDSIVEVGGRVYVRASVRLSGEPVPDSSQGQYAEVFAFARESQDKKGMDDAQITGAASSYARKYALNGLFCIDDTKDADTMDNRKKQPEEDFNEKFNTFEPRGEKPGNRPMMASVYEKQEIERLAVDMGGTYQIILDTWTEGKDPTAEQAIKILAALKVKKQALSKLLDKKMADSL